MNAQPHKVENLNSELARLLEEADWRPVDLEKNGVRYRVTRVPTDEPSASVGEQPYDPQRTIEAIHASAGALKDVDTDALLRTLYEERTQDSKGRPAE